MDRCLRSCRNVTTSAANCSCSPVRAFICFEASSAASTPFLPATSAFWTRPSHVVSLARLLLRSCDTFGGASAVAKAETLPCVTLHCVTLRSAQERRGAMRCGAMQCGVGVEAGMGMGGGERKEVVICCGVLCCAVLCGDVL